MTPPDPNSIVLPISWILSIISGLCGAIVTLAVTIWRTMASRLAAQDRIIDGLRADVERMSKGCGAAGCNWKGR